MKKAAKNQKQQVEKTTFLPSDYIMSSIDIAEAVGMDHQATQRDLFRFTRNYNTQTDGYVGIISGNDDEDDDEVYMFDIKALMEYADYLDRVYDSQDLGRKILSRFFYLASSPSEFPTVDYYSLWHKKSCEIEEISKFINRLQACTRVAENSYRES
jgi:hypothetical protein